MQTPQSIPMVHASIVATLMDYLDDLGAPLASGLAAARMPSRLVEDRSGYVPVRTYCGWVDQQARIQGIDNLGLLAVNRAGIGGLLPQLVASITVAPTLYAGLQSFAGLAYRESSQVSIWLDESQAPLRLCHQGSFPRSLPGQPDMSWWAIGSLIHVVRLFLGPAWQPDYAGVPAQGRGQKAASHLFPATRMIAEPAIAWIAIPRSALTVPPLRTTHDAMPAPASETLSYPPDTLEDSLTELVRLYLPDGAPRIEAAAEAAGLSVRTLQRRLAAKGLRYEHLVSNLRFEQACSLLVQRELPVNEISRRLGYSDSAHFARAFRRIAGVNPREYQRQLISGTK